jgi:predicted PurR-regulated permease PerM
LFAPLHRHLEAKLKRPNLAAMISVVAVALILLLVVAVIGERLVAEVVKGVAMVKTKVESGDWARALESHPYLAPIGRWIKENIDLTGAVNVAASFLATKGASVVQGSVIQLGALLLTFYFLFFFLRDRRKARHALHSLLPLSPGALDRIGQRIVDTINATLYGTLAVAAVQGTLGGLMFWALGLSAPVLWGVVMGVLAVVPVLGAFIVWIPAAVILALSGSWIKAIVLTAWGIIVVGGIDNLLYPILVGNRLQMHTAIAFIAMLGGLMVLGAPGIILGPLAVTITGALLELWRHREPDATDSTATTPMPEDTRE